VILLVASLAVGEGLLLNIRLLGLCFGNAAPSCPAILRRFDETSQWLLKAILNETVGLLVFAVVGYLLFTSTRIDIPAALRLRGSSARAMRFFGRFVLVWIVILVPLLLLDLGLWWSAEAFPVLFDSPALQWVFFLLRTGALVMFSALMHARLAFYLPSAAFSLEPHNWAQSWRSTRTIAGHLFAVFLLIEFLVVVAQFGLVMLLYRIQPFFHLVDSISDLIGVRSNYVMRNLGEVCGYVLIGVPAGLLELSVPLVVFKKVMSAADKTTADIFD
jgi:hypothetical protein